ncbi:MAG TPA: hypothetical protein VFW83_00285 [Bryobacteraceae bacterium]|nr:hypothetical protein [Bryobacteraceae bacterium]
MAETFWSVAAILLILALLLGHLVKQDGRELIFEFAPRRVHYVQLLAQGSIYFYWGWYWREVYRYVPLIAAQLLFAYALDMLISSWRRGKWAAGFGLFPIVLSTNLFLWFRDDWFFFQFLMIAVALLGREFVKWTRNSRRTHIFNPSASSLFVFAVFLMATHSTQITNGQAIAFTLSYPPHMYVEIFLVGLVVQAFFSVTLITFSAVSVLWALNVAYTALTGSHQFMGSNIPPLVFLGAHFLVTDPATSPRTKIGRIMFGGLYGAGVFATHGALSWSGLPIFFDKLLCIPVLNLSVQVLDWLARTHSGWFSGRIPNWKWSPRTLNLTHMILWSSLFCGLMMSGFLAETRGADDPNRLGRECIAQRSQICADWIASLRVRCNASSSQACLVLGRVLADGRAVPRDTWSAMRSFQHACDLGLSAGCTEKARAVVAAP